MKKKRKEEKRRKRKRKEEKGKEKRREEKKREKKEKRKEEKRKEKKRREKKRKEKKMYSALLWFWGNRGSTSIQGETRTFIGRLGKHIHRICRVMSLLWTILRPLSCRTCNRSCLAYLLFVFLALHRGMYALVKSARTWFLNVGDQ